MEKSPLRFLDYDMSLMLADQVRLSQEEEARRFHLNMWTANGTLDTRVLKGTIHHVFNGIKRYWGDFWDEELSGQITKMSFVHTFHGVVGRRIILYEQELEHIMDGPILYEQELEHIMDGRKYLKSNF